MGKQRKLATILLITALMVSSLILVQAAPVDEITKPKTPEFTVKIVAYPYDVPPETTTTTTIDEYTGKSTTTTNTKPGYHVENRSIEVTIKNQQFTPITITEYEYWSDAQQKNIEVNCNYTTDLFYNVRVKGHYGTNWKELYNPYTASGRDCGAGSWTQAPVKSNSQYTVISIPEDFPINATVDFQVRAMVGYYTIGFPLVMIPQFLWIFKGEFGDWSNTQVLTMGEVGATAVPEENQLTPTSTIEPGPTPTETQTPTPMPSIEPTQTVTATPTEPVTQIQADLSLNWEQTTIATVAVIIVVLASALIFLHKRRIEGGA